MPFFFVLETRQTWQFVILIYVFIRTEFAKSENLAIHGLPEAIFKLAPATTGRGPKIDISETQLLIVMDLQVIPLNICFWGWQFLLNYLKIAYSSPKASNSKMAANQGR